MNGKLQISLLIWKLIILFYNNETKAIERKWFKFITLFIIQFYNLRFNNSNRKYFEFSIFGNYTTIHDQGGCFEKVFEPHKKRSAISNKISLFSKEFCPETPTDFFTFWTAHFWFSSKLKPTLLHGINI